MAKPISVGKEDPIPGREEILEGKQEGWEVFCTFCVDFLTLMLCRYHLFKWEETPKQIALGITTRIFLAFKKSSETLAEMSTAGEIMSYLRRCAWHYRKTAAITERVLAKRPRTLEEREEARENLNKDPRFFLELAFPDAESTAEARELVALVEQGRRKLSQKRCEILDRATWGESHEMIGQAQKMNKKAVGQELNRARKDLLRHMPEDSLCALETFVGGQLRKLCAKKPRSKRAGAFQVSAVAS
jgi:hypothetical protein